MKWSELGWWRKPEGQEKTTNLKQVTCKTFQIRISLKWDFILHGEALWYVIIQWYYSLTWPLRSCSKRDIKVGGVFFSFFFYYIIAVIFQNLGFLNIEKISKILIEKLVFSIFYKHLKFKIKIWSKMVFYLIRQVL